MKKVVFLIIILFFPFNINAEELVSLTCPTDEVKVNTSFICKVYVNVNNFGSLQSDISLTDGISLVEVKTDENKFNQINNNDTIAINTKKGFVVSEEKTELLSLVLKSTKSIDNAIIELKNIKIFYDESKNYSEVDNIDGVVNTELDITSEENNELEESNDDFEESIEDDLSDISSDLDDENITNPKTGISSMISVFIVMIGSICLFILYSNNFLKNSG